MGGSLLVMAFGLVVGCCVAGENETPATITRTGRAQVRVDDAVGKCLSAAACEPPGGGGGGGSGSDDDPGVDFDDVQQETGEPITKTSSRTTAIFMASSGWLGLTAWITVPTAVAAQVDSYGRLWLRRLGRRDRPSIGHSADTPWLIGMPLRTDLLDVADPVGLDGSVGPTGPSLSGLLGAFLCPVEAIPRSGTLA